MAVSNLTFMVNLFVLSWGGDAVSCMEYCNERLSVFLGTQCFFCGELCFWVLRELLKVDVRCCAGLCGSGA